MTVIHYTTSARGRRYPATAELTGVTGETDTGQEIVLDGTYEIVDTYEPDRSVGLMGEAGLLLDVAGIDAPVFVRESDLYDPADYADDLYDRYHDEGL